MRNCPSLRDKEHDEYEVQGEGSRDMKVVKVTRIVKAEDQSVIVDDYDRFLLDIP